MDEFWKNANTMAKKLIQHASKMGAGVEASAIKDIKVVETIKDGNTIYPL